MKLILLRHGIAQDRLHFAGDDADRALTPEGIKKTKQVCDSLLDWWTPAVLVVSPLVRAVQTADLLQQKLTERGKMCHRLDNCLALLPEAGAQQWQLWLSKNWRFLEGCGSVLVAVGHEPNLSEILSNYLGLPEPSKLDFKKAGICVLNLLDPKRAILKAFIPPKVARNYRNGNSKNKPLLG